MVAQNSTWIANMIGNNMAADPIDPTTTEIRSLQPDTRVGLRLTPNGEPETWGSYFCAMFDDYESDNQNYRAIEMGTEKSGPGATPQAEINTFAQGNKSPLDLAFMMNGANDTMMKLHNTGAVAGTPASGCQITNLCSVLTHFSYAGAAPTTTDIPDGFSCLIWRTDLSALYLYANAGGTILKVQLT